MSRISKIRFCRFHRVFRLANIKTMFDALRRPCNYFKTARSWNEKPCNALGKTESPKSSFAGSIAFWQIWTSTSCLRGACGFSGFFGFYFRIATAKVVDFLKVRLWLFFAIEFRIPGNRRALSACSREGSALPSTHSPLIECRRYRNAGNCYSRDLIEHCEKHHELSMKFLTAFEKVKIPKMILKTMKDLNCHVWIVGKGKSDHWEYCGIVKKGRKHDSSKWVTCAWTTGGNYQRCGQCKP